MKKDRATRHSAMAEAHACIHKDCRRVVWNIFGPTTDDVPEEFHSDGCYECGRATVYERVSVPGDTIMLDEDGEPIPKSREDEI